MNTSYITLLTATPEVGKIVGFDLPFLFDLSVQWIALLILVFILFKLLFKPVTEFLEKRKNAIAQTINEANSQKASAAELKADYETKLSNIKEEANQILKDTRAQAVIREQQIIKAAKEEAESLKQKALNDIKLEQERIKDELKNEVIEISTVMANKFITFAIDEAKHSQLIDDAIKDMGAIQWLS